MYTIKDIIALINEHSWCADCLRPCRHSIGDPRFCGLDCTFIAMEYLTRGEY